MPIKVTCSNCGGVLHAPDDSGGKRGRCPTCGNILPIPAAGEAPKASMSNIPDAGAKPAGRQQSFGEFALGSQVGPPPGFTPGTQEAPPIGGGGKPAPIPEPPRASDPFARKGAKAAPGSGTVIAWSRVRGGLFWVQFAAFLLMLPGLFLGGLAIAEHFAKKDLIPDSELSIVRVGLRQALPFFVVGGCLLLGYLLMTLGRLGTSNMPRRGQGKGLALLATFCSFGCFAAVLVFFFSHVALMIGQGQPDFLLFPKDEVQGKMQRIAFLGLLGFGIVGEFLFASVVGRIGASLDDGKSAARSTKYLGLLMLIVVGLFVSASLIPSTFLVGPKLAEAGTETTKDIVTPFWTSTVQPVLAQAGEYQALIAPGLVVLCSVLMFLLYVRLAGAPRAAISEMIRKTS
jgi:hypothetical protein